MSQPYDKTDIECCVITNITKDVITRLDTEKDKEKDVSPADENEIIYKRFCCIQCTFLFSQKYLIDRYMGILLENHVQFQCFKCTCTPFIEEGLQTPTQSDFDKLDCCVCSFSTSRKSDFIYHMKTHTEEKPYKCTQCDKHFSQKEILKKHMVAHAGERPYECIKCDKSFSQNYNLKRHMETHIKEKSYHCIQCEKGFSRKDHLKRHLLTHTSKIHMETHIKEKSYLCNQCEKGFSRKDHLKRHLLTHIEVIRKVSKIKPEELNTF